MKRKYILRSVAMLMAVMMTAISPINPNLNITYNNVKLKAQTTDAIYYNDFTTETNAQTISIDKGDIKALKYEVNCDKAKDWDTIFQQELLVDYADKINKNAVMSFDIYVSKDADFSGSFKAQAVAKLGKDWTWTQAETIQEFKSQDFTVSGQYKKATVKIAFDNDMNEIKSIVPCLASSNCDYKGDIYLSNVKLVNGSEDGNSLKIDLSKNKWSDGGNWQYSGGINIDNEGNDKLKLGLDYTKDTSYNWSEAKINHTFDTPLNLNEYGSFKFDFIYDESKLSKGSFKAKLSAGDGAIDKDVDITNIEDYENGLKKATVTIEFSSVNKNISGFTLGIVGNETDYKGNVYIENMMFTANKSNIYVTATKKASTTKSEIKVNSNSIVGKNKNGNDENISALTNVSLADDNANESTVKLYAYLDAVGKSQSVLYGHQNDTAHKTGTVEGGTNSDTKDVTNSISAVVGIDTLSLTGNESGTNWTDTQQKRVQDVAKITKEAADQNAIITLSAHMPNFEIINERVKKGITLTGSENTESLNQDDVAKLSDGSYNFSGYTPGTTTGDIVSRIMPGQDLNYLYTAYLDLIADYANEVAKDDITILFRPFHENTGSWFWWGAAFCDEEAYKNLYKYTVEYLRDTKNVHNMLYVYGPGSEAENVEDYGKRYPGDDYIDMVGFDMYNSSPTEDNKIFFDNFESQLNIVQQFAKNHNKLVAVTETGIANGSNALLPTGNKCKDWYTKILDLVSKSDASYFLLWANFGETSGFYSPYVVEKDNQGNLIGHETLDSFIDFYNDNRTIFANQVGNYKNLSTKIQKRNEKSGYIISPISGNRITDSIEITAKLTNIEDNDKVQFILKSKTGETITLDTDKDNNYQNGTYYSAKLTKDQLQTLGEKTGTISLYINNNLISAINAKFNMQEPVSDPLVIDTFEYYYGEDAVLNSVWSTNKDTGCSIKPVLISDKDKYYEGETALEFNYTLANSSGWAGMTKSMDGADWSSANAYSFWTIPDGKNQKVVIQVTSAGNTFEVYLNEYDEYKNSTKPMLVTIPFSCFVGRDNKEAVFDPSSIDSVGFWCNAIDGTAEFPLTSTIYYDDVKVCKTDSKNIKFEEVTNKGNETNDNQEDIKVSLTRKTLYINKAKKKTAKVKFSLPENYVKVAKISDDIKDVVQVKFTYSLNNDNVSINKNGKITAKKVGKSVVTVKAKLSDGTTKKYKLKVKVK